MSMYLMKPWYATKQTGKTTTYETTSLSGSTQYNTYNYSIRTQSTWIANMQRCPSFSVKSSNVAETANTSYSYTLTYPKLMYTDLKTSNSLYALNSTNETIYTLSRGEITSYYSTNTANSGKLSRSTVGFGLKSGATIMSNNDYFNQGFYVSCNKSSTSNSSNLHPAYWIFRTESNNQTFNLISNIIHKGSSTYDMTKYQVVYFEITDPSKITVFLDEIPPGYANAWYTTSRSLTVYRATLSQA